MFDISCEKQQALFSLKDKSKNNKSVVCCNFAWGFKLVGWLFWALHTFETVFLSILGRLPERGRKKKEMIVERKNVQTMPARSYCKRRSPCPTLIHISRTPRPGKFTQHHHSTRPSSGTLRVKCLHEPAMDGSYTRKHQQCSFH